MSFKNETITEWIPYFDQGLFSLKKSLIFFLIPIMTHIIIFDCTAVELLGDMQRVHNLNRIENRIRT